MSEYTHKLPEYWVMHVTSIIPDDGAPYQIKVVNGPYPSLAPAWESAGRIRKFKPDMIFIAGDLVGVTMSSAEG